MTPWRQANLDPSSIMRSADRGYWAEIRRLARAEGLSVKAIVRRTGISRNAVRRALASQGPEVQPADADRRVRRGRATGVRAAPDGPADAGDGDRRTDR